MARGPDLPDSRKPGVESAATWILAMLCVGVLAALLVVAVAPPIGDNTDGPAAISEQVVPNTPPPVRTE
jgi:hypothetical protein